MLMNRSCAEHHVLARALLPVSDVYTLDARGHGDSGGRISFGNREPADVAALALSLRGSYDFVLGLGFSMGGYHVLAASAMYHVFDAIAIAGTPGQLRLVTGRSLARAVLRSIPMLMRRRRGWQRLSMPMFGNRPQSALTLIEAVAPTPLLICHGGDDWLVPVIHAHRLYMHAREPRELAIIPGGRHAESLITETSGVFLRRVSEFIEGSTTSIRCEFQKETTPHFIGEAGLGA
jgi:pimeloyl-ACP methyl ester carboxylesterase